MSYLISLACHKNSPAREDRFNGLSALIGDCDKKQVRDVVSSFYSSGFDVYLGGEIITL